MNVQLAAARMAACRKWPQATAAILSLVPVERPGLGTVAVDAYYRLYYDPEWLGPKTLGEATGLVAHEVSHLLLAHPARAKSIVPHGDRDLFKLWNIAADAAINPGLVKEQFALPPGGVYPKDLKLPENQPAEAYYRELLKRRKEQEGGKKGNQGQEAGGQGAQGVAGKGNSGTPGTDGGGASEDEGSPCDPVAPGTSGSCSDGQPRPWEAPAPTGDAEADEKNGIPPGLAPHEQKQIQRQVAEAMKAQGRGKGSTWEGFIKDILEPKIDPRVLLMRAVRNAVEMVTGGCDEWTYRRPSRRQSHGGLLRPSPVQLVPRITIVVDSSGSMDKRDLQLALGLIAKVLSGLRLRDGVQVIVGDDGVQSAGKVFDPKRLAIQGRGGTDMSGLIVHAAQAKPKPDVIVVATDGYTGWPSKPVGPKVVACLTREATKKSVPSWIETVILNP